MRFSVLCLGLLVSAACGSDSAATPDAMIDASTAPSIAAMPTTPTINPGGVLLVNVTTQNFKIIPPAQASGVHPGEGHYHYYLDDAANYVAAWAASTGVRIPSSAAVGEHMIRFVLVHSDHIEVNPIVETTVTFMVQ